jgi:hypothetical protein
MNAYALAPGPAVPPEYLGVWKRTLLRTPDLEDTTTVVHWLQTSSWHADLRVPAARPACAGKTALEQLSREELLGLATQQGFCGVTRVEGNICRWLRKYDYQPPSGDNDIGRMEFDTPDRVFEYGVERHYFEIWERVPGSAGLLEFAVTLPQEPESLPHVPGAFLLATGDCFMIVRPRSARLPQAGNLLKLATQATGPGLRDLLDFELSFGRIDGSSGRIFHSSLPWREGQVVPLPPDRPQGRGSPP